VNGWRVAARWATTTLLVAVGSIAFAAPAAAHPSDEILQQIYVTPAASGLTVQLELTPGVLVAPQFVGALDLDGDGALSPGEVDAHVAAVRSALSARVDGQPVELAVTERRYPPADLLGAGGGAITLGWAAPLPAGAHELVLTDRYEPGPKSTVQMSVLVPSDPVALGPIGHADSGRTMTVALGPDAVPAPGGAVATSPDASAASGSSMLDALRRPLTSPWALLVLVGACTLLGALHALTPGHGKALLAAYLVGGRGTPGQAITLGVVITFTHTAAVIAIGAAVLAAGQYVVPGVLVPVLTIVAGVLVLVLGIRLVRRRWSGHVHNGHGDHVHGDHVHDDHVHGGGVLAPPRMRSVAALGVSAGMIPCPEALSVLLLAIGLNRTALGMVMIVAFSVGLAAVLVGLGLLLVTSSPLLSRLSGRHPSWITVRLPLLSAVVVAILGFAMAVTGLSSLAG
jgi:nickel/cobalt transporter (NicO) family protein